MWCARVVVLELTNISLSVANKNPLCPLTKLTLRSSRRRFSSANISGAEQQLMSTEPKRIRTDNMTIKKIGTHNGSFHCDEVLACFFLRQLPEYAVGTGNNTEEKKICLGKYLTILFCVYFNTPQGGAIGSS